MPTISDLRTTIVDIPSLRPHRFASHQIDMQSYLVVAVDIDGGPTGVGEGVSPGGPWWGGESIEGQQAVIDGYLAPIVIGSSVQPIGQLMSRIDTVVHANHFAKAAVEMAVYDALGQVLEQPLHALLSTGRHRDHLPVRWALSAGDEDEVADEANQRLRLGHRSLKFKMGALEPTQDIARLGRLLDRLDGPARIQVDPNGTWDRRTAMWALAELEALGVAVLEQPLPRHDLHGMRLLTERSVSVVLMADESVCTPVDAQRAACLGAGDAVAVKPGKAGGLHAARLVGEIAGVGGMRRFGGTALESSIGTAASAHLCAALDGLEEDSELVGPQLLADDLVAQPLEYADGSLRVPDGPGLGITVDWDRVDKYTRR